MALDLAFQHYHLYTIIQETIVQIVYVKNKIFKVLQRGILERQF